MPDVNLPALLLQDEDADWREGILDFMGLSNHNPGDIIRKIPVIKM
jgi:hypothetical protein